MEKNTHSESHEASKITGIDKIEAKLQEKFKAENKDYDARVEFNIPKFCNFSDDPDHQRFDKEDKDIYNWFFSANDNDIRLSSIEEFNKVKLANEIMIKKEPNKIRRRTPMFLRKDRIEQAYKKRIGRFKKKSQEPKITTKKVQLDIKKKQLIKEVKESEPQRDFTSFGSKMRTTPSTSKRSSNDVKQADSTKSPDKIKEKASCSLKVTPDSKAHKASECTSKTQKKTKRRNRTKLSNLSCSNMKTVSVSLTLSQMSKIGCKESENKPKTSKPDQAKERCPTARSILKNSERYLNFSKYITNGSNKVCSPILSKEKQKPSKTPRNKSGHKTVFMYEPTVQKKLIKTRFKDNLKKAMGNVSTSGLPERTASRKVKDRAVNKSISKKHVPQDRTEENLQKTQKNSIKNHKISQKHYSSQHYLASNCTGLRKSNQSSMFQCFNTNLSKYTKTKESKLGIFNNSKPTRTTRNPKKNKSVSYSHCSPTRLFSKMEKKKVHKRSPKQHLNQSYIVKEVRPMTIKQGRTGSNRKHAYSFHQENSKAPIEESKINQNPNIQSNRRLLYSSHFSHNPATQRQRIIKRNFGQKLLKVRDVQVKTPNKIMDLSLVKSSEILSKYTKFYAKNTASKRKRQREQPFCKCDDAGDQPEMRSTEQHFRDCVNTFLARLQKKVLSLVQSFLLLH
ncbi:unnamed protein product [Moneuplotes crassus]|uniref:Uncharacterized protein n=1 Tax=Euplotes crassus TaxID=5936 RepID=A0AAD2D9F3_EUPCR|nr:unnamed protein product [Moneuplotes crassus]